MEAARVAAARGHEVTIFEKNPKLGGLLPLATLVKGMAVEDIPALIRYFEIQLSKLDVKVRLGKEFNFSAIDEIKPDVVILATGGIPDMPRIPGIEGKNVISVADMHRKVKFYLNLFGPMTLGWLTKLWMPVGKNVVIIGGDMQGCELAEFLVKRGRKVTITETSKILGETIPSTNRAHILPWLEQKGVKMLTEVKYKEITKKGLIVTTKEGKQEMLEADTILPATPLVSDGKLLKNLKGKAAEIYSIGDCREPQLIIDAIADGWRTARSI